MMRIDWDAAKERKNRAKHKLDFSFAELILRNPTAIVVFDRFSLNEERWHAFSTVNGVLLLVIYNHPDPDDDRWVRIISLRKATRDERKRFEKNDLA